MGFRRRVKLRCESGSMFSAIQHRTVPLQRGQTESGFGDGLLVLDARDKELPERSGSSGPIPGSPSNRESGSVITGSSCDRRPIAARHSSSPARCRAGRRRSNPARQRSRSWIAEFRVPIFVERRSMRSRVRRRSHRPPTLEAIRSATVRRFFDFSTRCSPIICVTLQCRRMPRPGVMVDRADTPQVS